MKFRKIYSCRPQQVQFLIINDMRLLLLCEINTQHIAKEKQTGFNKIVFDVCVMHVLLIHSFFEFFESISL